MEEHLAIALAAAGSALTTALAFGAGARAVRRKRDAARASRIAVLVHDLRSPLNTCLMWVEVLATNPRPDKAQAALDAIKRNLEREAELVDGLLEAAGDAGAKPAAAPRGERSDAHNA
jgi:signal transduction histidine kinase